MKKTMNGLYRRLIPVAGAIGLMCLGALQPAAALTLNVVDGDGIPVATSIRWMLEEDNTVQTPPGVTTNDSLTLVIHKSHAPVAAKGESAVNPAVIAVPDAMKPYYLSVLAEGYQLGGNMVAAGQTDVTVVLNKHRLPTAQISIFAFKDHFPINNSPDLGEQGLAGFGVKFYDAAGYSPAGDVMQDVFGNPLGTTYQTNGVGDFIEDVDGNPVVEEMGTGFIMTDENGEASIKYIAPGKYGVQIVPPETSGGHGSGIWQQTTTIEGTLGIDCWVQADEPRTMIEFGLGTWHVFVGFIKTDELPWNATPPTGAATISGRLVNNHYSQPPLLEIFPGAPVPEGWIALNDLQGTGGGLYAGPCNADGTFSIPNVPDGTYQLVTFDKRLLRIIGFTTVIVEGGQSVVLGDLACNAWFGEQEGSVFHDVNENGFREPDEVGMPQQAINLRFRDGTMYQATVTDENGDYELVEIFPFFKWLITEVDYARFKPTGMTAVTDAGGEVPPHDGWTMPSFDKLTPQVQAETNTNTGNALSRTETGPVLLEAFQNYAGMVNRIDWGKSDYAPGENGGIAGIAFYSTTRAEEDPANAVGDPWEPGIPRVQFVLYGDANADRIIDDLDSSGGVTLADVDNYPLGWNDGSDPKGPEDVDHDNDGTFDPGDALQIVWSDSFDDLPPEGALNQPPPINGLPVQPGADSFGTWNQVRPGVFDGGYWFNSYFPGGMANTPTEVEGLPSGMYIVQSVPPPGYLIQTEESMNVGFGDSFKPSKKALVPACVGTRINHGGAPGDAFVSDFVPSLRTDPYTVADVLTLFPDQAEPAPFAGEVRPLPDMKWVRVANDRNAAADFHLYTEVPKAARAVGLCNNDLGAAFNPAFPTYGEKDTPLWIPISFRDWAGNEIARVYADSFGAYNALLPSTYSINIPMPSGVSPNMISVILNDPTMPDPANPGQRIADPHFDPDYATAAYPLQYFPGTTTYPDTPVLPIGAFVGGLNNRMDVEAPDGTPGIYSAEGASGGPLLTPIDNTLTIRSLGPTEVLNPAKNATNAVPLMITRDYGFGGVQGTVTINGIPLSITSWNDTQIVATAPAGAPSGQLLVTRGDNGRTTRIGVTVTMAVSAAAGVHHVVPAPLPATPIQDALDAAQPGDLVLVGPGEYDESPIMWKPVKLQGSGMGTIINAAPLPSSRLQTWHDKAAEIYGTPGTDPFEFNALAGITVCGDVGFAFDPLDQARIDGFSIVGGQTGGGVYLHRGARHFTISNNRIRGNRGEYAGGIAVGIPGGGASGNDHVLICNNEILKNGMTAVNSQGGAGGIGLFAGADDYVVRNNLIQGNLSTANGGGISHLGLSQRGNITANQILFNEVVSDVLGYGAGGGVYLAGDALAGNVTPGAGTVTINANLIQGNLGGAGHGGGIRTERYSGADVAANPGNPNAWHRLNIYNNVIVNNVAGYAGGGISLEETARSRIIHNTVANNDATATAALAFQGAATSSEAQGAGIVAHAHSDTLAAASGQTFANPTLYDNIVWHNRSYYLDAAANGGAGDLVANPAGLYQDLQVFGTAGILNPRSCLLTSTNGYHSSNRTGDPLFTASYFNTLMHASVVDEARRAVWVRYDEINPAGNYHIDINSPAVGAAEASMLNAIPELRGDIDTDYRPYGANPDIGADEYSVPTVFATNDAFTVNENALLQVLGTGVLSNDSPGGLTAELVTPPAHGSANPLSSSGQINYRPATNFSGIDSFTYRARLGAARSRPAQVTIVVRPVNVLPSAADDAFDVNGNTTLSVPVPGVLGNDADVDFDPLTAVWSSGPDNGLLTLNADGSFDYTPDLGFDGVDTFIYTANDGTVDSAPAVVTLTVSPPAPDLVVESISLIPGVVTNGGFFEAIVKVSNLGSVDADGGRLALWLDQPGADLPPGLPGDAYVDLGVIPGGTSTSVTFSALSAPLLAPGIDQIAPTFRAFADSLGVPGEFDENNNQTVQEYLVVRYAGTPAALNQITNGTLVAQDTVTIWNRIALEMVKTNAQMAPMAARTLAMVHGAMYDAVNGGDGTYNPYRVLARPAQPCSPDAAAAAAAHAVLSGIYTGQVAYLNQALANSLALVANGEAKNNGLAYGADIGLQMLDWRMHDHMLMMDTNYVAGVDPGDWRPTPPGYMPPMMPAWGTAMPFSLLHDMTLPLPPEPPALDSAEYAAAVNEVQAIGSATSATRTPAQAQAVTFWTDMPGTVTTVGRWNQIAREVAAQQNNTLAENARLFALLNVGLADAGITAWQSKYTYNRWRPIAAIREADTDGNPATVQDAGWTPLVTTPPFPEYVSAHSTFSAAAAGILANFFGTDDLVFPAEGYMNPAHKRFFGSFSAAAYEAGVERVWGGIHFSYGNEQALTVGYAVGQAVATSLMQPSLYPPDTDGVDTDGDGDPNNDVVFLSLAAGDGFSKMADGNELYTFGFSDQTLPALSHAGMAHGHYANPMVVHAGMMKAEASSPTIVLKEGQRFYLDVSNVGMMMRPDLFDPHTVHFHGVPNAAPIFDGEPMASVSINMGNVLRYYYEIVEPGTFLYHCHVEATEHMEMGMIGNLYVLPKQNNLPDGTSLGAFTHHAGYTYAYNDGDGSTRYDVDAPLQLTAFDRTFHEEHIKVQPLPFWSLDESYPMINGRGYPDTIDPAPLYNASADNESQKVSSLITATSGQKILLRISNVSISDFHTLTVLGIPMTVVGKDARLLRSTGGQNLYYRTTSVTLGGGETADVLLDTTGVAPGTYFVYDARLNHLSNDQEDYGGMMTEIVIQ